MDVFFRKFKDRFRKGGQIKKQKGGVTPMLPPSDYDKVNTKSDTTKVNSNKDWKNAKKKQKAPKVNGEVKNKKSYGGTIKR